MERRNPPGENGKERRKKQENKKKKNQTKNKQNKERLSVDVHLNLYARRLNDKTKRERREIRTGRSNSRSVATSASRISSIRPRGRRAVIVVSSDAGPMCHLAESGRPAARASINYQLKTHERPCKFVRSLTARASRRKFERAPVELVKGKGKVARRFVTSSPLHGARRTFYKSPRAASATLCAALGTAERSPGRDHSSAGELGARRLISLAGRGIRAFSP